MWFAVGEDGVLDWVARSTASKKGQLNFPFLYDDLQRFQCVHAFTKY